MGERRLLLLSRESDSAAESLRAFRHAWKAEAVTKGPTMPSDTQYEPFYSDGYLVLAASLLVDGSPWPKFPINLAVQSVLFTAFAAEAFINLALTVELSERTASDVDRWTTQEKFLYGPWLMTGEPVLDRANEPFQGLNETFKRRNEFATQRRRRP